MSDDEGWRVEIKALPELTRVGAWRGADLPLVPQHGSGPAAYGGFYTQEQIRRIVAHAARLNIAIVPEIDIPGHCSAVLKSYPHLVDPGEKADSYWSIQGYANNALNPGMDATYAFLETVLNEVASLFPGAYIHIGADGVGPGAWLTSPLAQALMQAEGLRDTHDLQAHLLWRVQAILARLGKKMAGWDEVSQGGGVVAMGTLLVAWQNAAVIGALAEQGYDVVAAPGQAYYLDMVQADGWDEPGAGWADTVTPQACYDHETLTGVPAGLQHRVKGVQACIWGEHLSNKNFSNRMVFPRFGAVAEAGWTLAANKDWSRFRDLCGFLPKLCGFKWAPPISLKNWQFTRSVGALA